MVFLQVAWVIFTLWLAWTLRASNLRNLSLPITPKRARFLQVGMLISAGVFVVRIGVSLS